ncbi:hypothetical protein ACQR1I_10010 [Bradyrhizobium sp. HKCCYLS2038]
MKTSTQVLYPSRDKSFPTPRSFQVPAWIIGAPNTQVLEDGVARRRTRLTNDSFVSAQAARDCHRGRIFSGAPSSKISKEAQTTMGPLWILQMTRPTIQTSQSSQRTIHNSAELIVVATLAADYQITGFDSNPLQFRRERDSEARIFDSSATLHHQMFIAR